MFDLKGIYCPIATPFIDDKIAYDKLDENLDFWISSKLEGIVVMVPTASSYRCGKARKRS